jgi:hypothetical protein
LGGKASPSRILKEGISGKNIPSRDGWKEIAVGVYSIKEYTLARKSRKRGIFLKE